MSTQVTTLRNNPSRKASWAVWAQEALREASAAWLGSSLHIRILQTGLPQSRRAPSSSFPLVCFCSVLLPREKPIFQRPGAGVLSSVITKIFRGMLATLSATCLVTGCQSTKPNPKPEVVMEPSTRNNCYSLLHQLLSEEKDVSLLRFIKHEQDDVKRLINRIAATSKAGAEMLERFAKQDPSLNLKDIRLPSGETDTREAIAETKKHELLHEKDQEFELALILSQAEAVRYASHLAKVAAKNDSQPERSQALARLSGEMEGLYQELVAVLSVRESAHTNAKPRLSSSQK